MFSIFISFDHTIRLLFLFFSWSSKSASIQVNLRLTRGVASLLAQEQSCMQTSSPPLTLSLTAAAEGLNIAEENRSQWTAEPVKPGLRQRCCHAAGGSPAPPPLLTQPQGWSALEGHCPSLAPPSSVSPCPVGQHSELGHLLAPDPEQYLPRSLRVCRTRPWILLWP